MNSSLRATLSKLSENFALPDEDLDEMNVTSNLDGGLGQPNTPYAFSKKVQTPDDESYSDEVEPTHRFFKQINDVCVRSLKEVNYKDYKGDETRSEKEKINANIVEINRKLREVEQMITHASRLKTESGSDQTVFWKGTLNNFTKINERLIRLSSKIREFNS